MLKPGRCGCFLEPPNHPTYSWEISDRNNLMSLNSVEENPSWFDKHTIERAKELLANWNKLPIDHPEVQAWIHEVLGYFKNCFANQVMLHVNNDKRAWNASHLYIMNIDPFYPHNMVDEHAGVHLIRKHYPDFIPTEQDFKLAYWGKKPTSEKAA